MRNENADVTCLWPVQEERYSPVEQGRRGLRSSNEQVYSGHVNMSVRQQLLANTATTYTHVHV